MSGVIKVLVNGNDILENYGVWLRESPEILLPYERFEEHEIPERLMPMYKSTGRESGQMTLNLTGIFEGDQRAEFENTILTQFTNRALVEIEFSFAPGLVYVTRLYSNPSVSPQVSKEHIVAYELNLRVVLIKKKVDSKKLTNSSQGTLSIEGLDTKIEYVPMITISGFDRIEMFSVDSGGIRPNLKSNIRIFRSDVYRRTTAITTGEIIVDWAIQAIYQKTDDQIKPVRALTQPQRVVGYETYEVELQSDELVKVELDLWGVVYK